MVQRCALHCAQCEAEKGRAGQKQRSDFLAAPVHKAPPGRQKSEREFCLFGGVLFVRRAAPYGRLAVLARPAAVVLACAPGAPAFFLPVLRCLVPGLRAVCCFCAWSGLCCQGLLAGNVPACFLAPHFSFIFCLFLPNFFLSNFFSFVAQAATGIFSLVPFPRLCFRPACLATCCFFANFCAHCLFFRFALFARVFSLLFFALSCLTSSSQISFHLSFMPRTGIFSLVPSRGFVPGLHVLSPAAFSRTFAPIACLPVLRCLCELSLVFLPFPA